MSLQSMFQKTRSAVTTARCQPVPAGSERVQRVMLLAFVSLLALMPDVALAQGSPFASTAEQVLAIFTGGLTRTIAIIAVIACGIAAVAGKLSWDWAIKIIIGIVLIFGAASIVDLIIAGSGG